MNLVEATNEPLIGHEGKVWSLSWNPRPCNGAKHMLVSCGDDGTIVWKCENSISNWSILTKLKNGDEVSLRSCAWHNDGNIIATGGSKLILWEYKQDIQSLFGPIAHLNAPQDHVFQSISWNNHGTLLLCCTNDGSVWIIRKDNNNYEFIHVKSLASIVPLSSCAWNQTGRLFCVSGFRSTKIFFASHTFDNVTVSEVCSVDHSNELLPGSVNGISFLPFGPINEPIFGWPVETIVTAGADGKLRFWRCETKYSYTEINVKHETNMSIASQLEAHDGTITSVDVSRQPSRLGTVDCLIASACMQHDINICRQFRKKRKRRRGSRGGEREPRERGGSRKEKKGKGKRKEEKKGKKEKEKEKEEKGKMENKRKEQKI